MLCDPSTPEEVLEWGSDNDTRMREFWNTRMREFWKKLIKIVKWVDDGEQALNGGNYIMGPRR